MRRIIYYHTALLILGALFLILSDAKWPSASFMFGVGFSMLNLFSHIFVWRNGITKKLIALSAMVIVFKYAIFAAIIYWILGLQHISPMWFCVGVGSLVFTTFFVAISKEEYVV